jgi:hypothetical protein
MWWDYQNLNAVRSDKSGTKWHFRVWHDVVASRHVARVFFWEEKRRISGVVLLSGDSRSDVRYLHGLIQKRVADPKLRAKHQRQIDFPLERHYQEYGTFPEERSD